MFITEVSLLLFFIGISWLCFPDLVVIPHTRVQATEQWGLITFRESSVFYDLQEDTCDTYVSKMTSLAHEISHTVSSASALLKGIWSQI